MVDTSRFADLVDASAASTFIKTIVLRLVWMEEIQSARELLTLAFAAKRAGNDAEQLWYLDQVLLHVSSDQDIYHQVEAIRRTAAEDALRSMAGVSAESVVQRRLSFGGNQNAAKAVQLVGRQQLAFQSFQNMRPPPLPADQDPGSEGEQVCSDPGLEAMRCVKPTIGVSATFFRHCFILAFILIQHRRSSFLILGLLS